MRTLCIPSLGTELILAEDWTFYVVNESRNSTLFTWLNLPGIPLEGRDGWSYPLGWQPQPPVPPGSYFWYRRLPVVSTIYATLPKGTKLKIDRIYIRKGQTGFDSVTFVAPELKTLYRQQKKSVRFFAKLDDVNKMVIE